MYFMSLSMLSLWWLVGFLCGVAMMWLWLRLVD